MYLYIYEYLCICIQVQTGTRKTHSPRTPNKNKVFTLVGGGTDCILNSRGRAFRTSKPMFAVVITNSVEHRETNKHILDSKEVARSNTQGGQTSAQRWGRECTCI